MPTVGTRTKLTQGVGLPQILKTEFGTCPRPFERAATNVDFDVVFGALLRIVVLNHHQRRGHERNSRMLRAGRKFGAGIAIMSPRRDRGTCPWRFSL